MFVLDFETFFADDFTLSAMTTEEYVRDPRFEPTCLVVQDGPMSVSRGRGPDDTRELLGEARGALEGGAVACWNAKFDGFILAERYGIRPKFWVDGMLMARYVFGTEAKVSLAAIAARMGLAEKTVPYDRIKGKRWHQMDPGLQDALVDGCADDCELTAEIIRRLAPLVPVQEMLMIDMTIRMFTEPAIALDPRELNQLLQEDEDERYDLLVKLGFLAPEIERSAEAMKLASAPLRSTAKFKALLEAREIEVELKKGKNGPIPALASKDRFFEELLAGEYGDEVALLAEARALHSSSIYRTRAQRFLDISARGLCPVPIKYRGAHTARWSGEDRLNMQNVPKKGRLRRAIRPANSGHVFVTVDKSQIELRENAFLAEHEDLVAALASGRDIYCEFATKAFDRPITKAENFERQVGKVVNLASGFGMGHKRLFFVLASAGCGVPIEQAYELIQLWRAENAPIVRGWRIAEKFGLPALAGELGPVEFYKCRLEKGRLVLPDGTVLIYDVFWHAEHGCWARNTMQGWRRMTGPTLIENIVQATARCDLRESLVAIKSGRGIWPVLSSHDDATWSVPRDEAAEFAAYAVAVFSRAPSWMPGIPLSAEAIIGETYAK